VVAWLLPWFLHKKLKPSMGEITLQALKNGTRIGYECIKSRIDECIGRVLDQRSDRIEAAQNIQRECQDSCFPQTENLNTTLSRMLTRPSETAKA
ncbi:MAG: hypothetical protein ACRERS_10435, partial [Methylococcales bacterium]